MNQAGETPIAPSASRWQFLAGLMNEMGLKTFVEVGCKEGRTTAFILKEVPDAKVVAIDPWQPVAGSDDRTRETYKDWDFAEIERMFWANVGENKDRVDMLRMTSIAAAAMLHVEQFDLVFIDALHDYESVSQDIEAWWPKVRPGGVLAFHDYNHKWPGVERAIADRFDLMHVGLGPDSTAFTVKPHA